MAEQLGTLTCELQTGIAAHVVSDKLSLAAAASVCALLDAALPEGEPGLAVYERTRHFLQSLDADADCLSSYLNWEVSLLASLGFGFDPIPSAFEVVEGGGVQALAHAMSLCQQQLETTVFEGRSLPFARRRLADLSRTNARPRQVAGSMRGTCDCIG
jgi:hypothetical protein